MSLEPGTELPRYDRAALTPSIVHIGVGGFHRAHLATYVDELCRAGLTDWSIVGAGVMPGDSEMASALLGQDGLYSLIVRGADSTDVTIIASITDYIHASPDPASLIDCIAAPATQLVSMTITEGGYPVDDVTGAFDPDSPVSGPGSSFAIVAAALDKRRLADGQPLTIMSCDNIMSNGLAARASTLGEAAAIGPDLVEWIEANVSFPNSMVDRITPATTDADREWLRDQRGIDDRWPVVAEPFRQWVIEDDFKGARPPLEMLDVIVTNDVKPYEHMKLQLLNAGHSCLAYLGALLDCERVDEAMADEHIRGFLAAFLAHEAQPVVPAVDGIDLDDYVDSLVERFSNPEVGDQIARLCLDGSAKFPKFLLPTVRAQLDAGGPVALAALALAGWCEYLNGTTESGAPIERSSDPLLDAAITHAAASKEDPAAFLSFAEVFGSDLPADRRFVNAFTAAVESLRTNGVRFTIEQSTE